MTSWIGSFDSIQATYTHNSVHKDKLSLGVQRKFRIVNHAGNLGDLGDLGSLCGLGGLGDLGDLGGLCGLGGLICLGHILSGWSW